MMTRLKRMIKSQPPVASDADPQGIPQEEIELLLLGMFRGLPPDQRQTVLEIVTEIYSLANRPTC